MKIRVLIMSLFLFLVLSGPIFSAQQEDEDIDYTFGEVTRVMNDKITLNEYDFDSDNFADFEYTVDDKTEFDNIPGIGDIKIGETLELDYVTRDDKRIAVYIANADVTDEDETEIAEDEEPSDEASADDTSAEDEEIEIVN